MRNVSLDELSSDKLFYSKLGQEMLKSNSDDVIYSRGSNLQKTPVMFHSAIDIRNKDISRRDAKILELMMKRYIRLLLHW